ncbi:PhoX family protein [Novispirillum itersonii]|uniref:dTDP-glucose 4,6-dehydratase n=1 Tax=Novispirillum itersonii TaxID=189 RepID=A0A7W9ZG93_NOVIT|nr:PhoX family phosphatase [Novispirillum itersonii]MBB6210956.1 hypothetical protein [Novispirillum itersonii]
MTADINRTDLTCETACTEQAPALNALIDARLSRRAALRGLFVSSAAVVGGSMVSHFAMMQDAEAATAMVNPGVAGGKSTLGFTEIDKTITDNHRVAPGYTAQVLIRWGDKVEPRAEAFDPRNQSAWAQAKQFGYNNDYVGYLPLPAGSNNSDHGLLFVNHEYTNTELMFPGLTEKDAQDKVTKAQVETEMAAHGNSVIEVKKENGKWRVVQNSIYARRISFLTTEMMLSGPVAGHDRVKTKADPTGTRVLGTLNNCAGGKTPWGTVLTAEENFHQYFSGTAAGTKEAENHKMYGIEGKPAYGWGKHFDRMNVDKEPNEPNRFGWLVEVDPYDPTLMPRKRTAMGRFKHEAAGCAVNPDGTVTVYTGDDERFQYLYRFVTKGKYHPEDRQSNLGLLDDGTLYVAKFEADGTLRWLPMIYGQGPLTPANGFHSVADVLIETRRAAKLVGATSMDRPEDVEVNPVTGNVYAMLTNNTKRTAEQADAANPRAKNAYGHVMEMIPPAKNGKADHSAPAYQWDIFLLAGDPSKPEHGAKYHPDVSTNGWLACPDNCAFDPKGRLWISTDQGSEQAKNKISDGIYAADVSGPGRALTKFFYATPRDAEMCGPEFTPDGKTLFVAVQHPGEGKDSTFDKPSTRFPDFNEAMPPRPSIVAITRNDGGEIGG